MAQRSARSPVLILSVSVSCPLGSQSPLCPRCKSGPTVSRLQTRGGGSHGVPAANLRCTRPAGDYRRAAARGIPSTSRRGFQAGEESVVG